MSIPTRAQSRASRDVAGANVGAEHGVTTAKLVCLSPQVAVIVVLGVLGMLVFGASLARAAEPWWRLSSGSRPSSLTPGLATDEVQEVAVKGSGSFTLAVTTAKGLGYINATGETTLGDFVTNEGTFRVGDTLSAVNLETESYPPDTKIVEVGTETLTVSAPAKGGSAFFERLAATETTAAIPVGATAAEVKAALTALPGVGAGDIEVTGGNGGPFTVTFQGAFSYLPVALMRAGGTADVQVGEQTRGRADGEVVVTAENVGDVPLSAEEAPATIAGVLPSGLEAVSIEANEPAPNLSLANPRAFPCALATLSCKFGGTAPYQGGFLPRTLAAFDRLEIRMGVRVRPGATGGEAIRLSASGGGAPAASFTHSVRIGSDPASFGVEDYRLTAEDEGGAPTAQAGAHPFQVTGGVVLNQGPDSEPINAPKPEVGPVGMAKDIITKLPPGLLGNPLVVPRCTGPQFLHEQGGGLEDACPAQSAIGVASIVVNEPRALSYFTVSVPIFNLEPDVGEPARFGFYIPLAGVPVPLDTSLRDGPGEDDGIDVDTTNISQIAALTSATLTFWGVPGDPRHDDSRGWTCLDAQRGKLPEEGQEPCIATAQTNPPAFLTLPTSCAGPLQTSVEADDWQAPGAVGQFPSSELQQALEGCNRLPFAPAVSAEATTENASAPSGLNFNLNFHDEGLTRGEGTAQSELNKTVVKLPEGLTINPSAGVGLGGCSPSGYANETIDSVPGAGCPNDSKLGTVEIETPLLSQKVHGSIFVAQPHDNPFDSLVALYVVAKSPETGVMIRLAGRVVPDPVTGQLTTVFENNPPLAFSHFNFHFREGQQAPLISPSMCGTYTTQAELSPWSEPTAALTDTSSFSITRGYDGGACPSGGVPPFTPGIEAGLLNNNAGAFSPLYLHLTRTDGEQYISGFSTNLPPGLTGDLTGIPFCSESAIEAARHKSGRQEEAEPSCPVASQVGHTLVGTGVGAVLAYVPGKIYLAGPFRGAPFSLVAVTSAVVGPFDLGTVVLRFGLNIDPYTAQVSVSPTSSEPIPTILQGIVTHVRDIRVYIERPGNAPFTLNPTSCNPMGIGSTLSSPGGASATVASPFQATNCASLKFAPKFAVSTSGKTSKASGASLHVALTYPSAPLGTYANIAKVKVELPKQLPSRLTTLQKACTAAQFEANPAGCPSPSVIGSARVVVPNIPEPLTGPVYFVSHGGEAFPSLEVVLQGYGVKVILVGSTFISKAGITSTTFKAIPDNPVSSFELTLPEGKYSALAANGSLCTQKLTMPTDFTGQNGMEADYKTPVSVTGCAKAKALTRAQKLKAALKTCKKDRLKAKRAKCETAARKKYGPVKSKRKAKKKSGTKR
jgi:hypothetical protein